MHLYPQWKDAKYEHGQWLVNLKEWRLGEYSRSGEWSLTNLLKKGKKTIEKMILPIDSDYRCIALRAGGYNIQPSQNIVKAMTEAGLKIDTSIYPGGKESGMLSKYDYTTIPFDYGFWHTDNILERRGEYNIVELPIVAFPIIRFSKYLSIERIKSLLQNRKSAKDTFAAKTNGNKKSQLNKFKFFLQKESQTWDFCLFSIYLHKKFTKKISKQRNRNIFVIVGHPKSFTNGTGFKYLLSKTAKKYKYSTITELYNKGYFNVY